MDAFSMMTKRQWLKQTESFCQKNEISGGDSQKISRCFLLTKLIRSKESINPA